jgi:hypothetical protein
LLRSCTIWNITLDTSACWNLEELMHYGKSDEANDLLTMWMFSEVPSTVQNRDNEEDARVYHLWQLHFTELLVKSFSLRIFTSLSCSDYRIFSCLKQNRRFNCSPMNVSRVVQASRW